MPPPILATVVPPMEIAPGMGSIAMFGDPAGNTVGLYSLPPGWDEQMPPKGNAPPVVHFEVGGSDAAALAEFYTGMFAWQIDYHEETGYRLVQQEPGGIGGGIFELTEDMLPNHPSVAVMVNDLRAYLDRAVSLGGSDSENLIPRGGLVVLAGKPGVGKTTLAVDLVFHLASRSRTRSMCTPGSGARSTSNKEPAIVLTA